MKRIPLVLVLLLALVLPCQSQMLQSVVVGQTVASGGAACSADGSPDEDYNYSAELDLGMASAYAGQGTRWTPASTITVCKIALEHDSQGTPSNNTMTLAIYQDGDADANLSPGELVVSANHTGIDSMSEAFDIFDIADTEFTGSTEYTIVISGGDGTDYYSFYRIASDQSNELENTQTYSFEACGGDETWCITNDLTGPTSLRVYYYD